MSPVFALRFAARNLVRGGQRTLLATGCIAFGVLSLVALQLLSSMIGQVIMCDPREILGGDASVDRGGAPFTEQDLELLGQLHREGVIEASCLYASSRAFLLKREGSGRAHFVSKVMGVDTAAYPLFGEVRLDEPAGATLEAVTAEPGSAVVTRDLADKLGLALGDSFSLAGAPASPPARFTVTGIAGTVPGRIGDGVVYSLETARRIAGRPDVVTGATVRWAAEPRPEAFEAAGWSVRPSSDVARGRERVVELFDFMLAGTGLLGLLIGGIGVSNTMQVLLERRRTEIASLKTLGYERRHLVLLFGLEAALLGICGSVAGAVAAVGFSWPLMVLMGNIGTMLLEWTVDPWIVGGGVFVGVATAVIFGMRAIVRACAVRPATLLRDLPTPLARGQALVLYTLLGALFAGLCGLVLGSVWKGMAVAAFGAAGLGLLGLVLGTGFYLTVRLPLPGPALLDLARNSLRRQPGRVLVALIALFCGVFTIGFSGTTMLNANERLARRTASDAGQNLAVFAPKGDGDRIASEMSGYGVDVTDSVLAVSVRVKLANGKQLQELAVLEGRNAPAPVQIVEGTLANGRLGVLAPAGLRDAPWHLGLGSELTVEGSRGDRVPLHVEGFYTAERGDGFGGVATGLLGTREVAAALTGDAASVRVVGRVGAERLDTVAEALGDALPEATVVSRGDLNAAMRRAFVNLFIFVVTVASLALLAGAVLIANAVGLAMIERRRELGILKAIGYSRGRVLLLVVLEYALLGLLAAVAGIAGIAIAVAVVNRWQPAAELALDPVQTIVLASLAVVVALASALVAAWGPVRARPLEVLRSE